jgi:hypothetical protein
MTCPYHKIVFLFNKINISVGLKPIIFTSNMKDMDLSSFVRDFFHLAYCKTLSKKAQYLFGFFITAKKCYLI